MCRSKSLCCAPETNTTLVVVKLLSLTWLFANPWTVEPTRLLCPWDFPGKNSGMGCHEHLPGIFPA